MQNLLKVISSQTVTSSLDQQMGLGPLSEERNEKYGLSLQQVKPGQEGGLPQTRERALTKNQTVWFLDLGLPSPENGEEKMPAVYATSITALTVEG